MDQGLIFGIGLGLQGTPLLVDLDFDRDLQRLYIRLNFPLGSRFPRPDTGQHTLVDDTEEKSWCRMNLFQFECCVHAFVPRVDGGPGAGVKRVAVPWARPQTGFSLLRVLLMLLSVRSGMTVSEAAHMVGELPQRLWKAILHLCQNLKTRATNGAAEAFNGIIQTAKRKARISRIVEYFTAMIWLVGCRL